MSLVRLQSVFPGLEPFPGIHSLENEVQSTDLAHTALRLLIPPTSPALSFPAHSPLSCPCFPSEPLHTWPFALIFACLNPTYSPQTIHILS